MSPFWISEADPLPSCEQTDICKYIIPSDCRCGRDLAPILTWSGTPINDAENEADDKGMPSGVVETNHTSGLDIEEIDEPAALKEFPNKMAQFLSAINKVGLSSAQDLQNKFGLIDFTCHIH